MATLGFPELYSTLQWYKKVRARRQELITSGVQLAHIVIGHSKTTLVEDNMKEEHTLKNTMKKVFVHSMHRHADDGLRKSSF